jgi:hypothetical protein
MHLVVLRGTICLYFRTGARTRDDWKFLLTVMCMHHDESLCSSSDELLAYLSARQCRFETSVWSDEF